jgi:hypothetical protein
MSTRDDYRQNAFDCLRLAQTARNPGDKAMFIRMAQTWTRLADQVATISDLAEYAALRVVNY